MNRVLGLDTVRAIAALSVMLAHMLGPSLPEPARYMFTGAPAVMAFFVVSGFCIHFPYRERRFQTVPFLCARALRIFIPALFALCIAQAIGMKAYNFVDGYILWSIVCEAFYYAAYPLLRLAAAEIGWKALTAISFFVSYTIVLGLGSDQYGNIHIYGWYLNWVVMLPAWMFGVILAENFKAARHMGNIWLWRGATGLIASILYWATLKTPTGFYLTLNPFALLVAGWILAEIANAVRRPSHLLEKVGKWSYSIYLIHTIAWTALGRISGSSPPLLAIPFALGAAYLFYRVIELPAHKLARLTFSRLRMGRVYQP